MTTMAGDRRNKAARKALVTWKMAAIWVAIIDLILTISNCRNMGRFLLLVTMTSTFDSTPENVIGDYCQAKDNMRRGICETYSQMVETGSLTFPAEMSGRSARNGNSNRNADTEEQATTSGDMKATLSIQTLPPEMFKEFVMSSKSTFDPSRTHHQKGNISFYLDDEDVERIHGELQFLQYQQTQQRRNSHWHSNSPSQRGKQKHASLSQSGSNTKDSSNLNQKNKGGERLSPFGGNQEPESHLNSKVREFDRDLDEHMPTTTTTATKEGVDVSKTLHLNNPHSSSSTQKNQEIGLDRKTRGAQPLLIQIQPEDEDVNKNRKNNSPTTQSNSHIGETVQLTQNEKESESNKAPTTFSPQEAAQEKKNKDTNSISNQDFHSSPSNHHPADHHGKPSSHSEGNDPLKNSKKSDAGDKPSCISDDSLEYETKPLEPGPKHMINYLTQEIFGQWHTLLQKAQALIKQPQRMESSSLDEQFKSPEAKRITMHIQLQPFGPDALKSAAIRKKAVEQTLFDNPYWTLNQLYYKLSGNFINLVLVICLYTWICDAFLTFILYTGVRTENPIIIEGWMIFSILYSFLYYMIENWIHTNINPIRCSVDYWLFNFHSMYKVVAFTVVGLLWYNLKPFDTERRRCLNSHMTTTTVKSASAQFSPSSEPSLSSGTTTKESTIVDINMTEILPSSVADKGSNTAAALMNMLAAASTLRQGKILDTCKSNANNPASQCNQNQKQKQDEYEDGADDEEEEEDSDFSSVETDTDEDDDQCDCDLEKGENDSAPANTHSHSSTTTANLNIRGCGYMVQQ